LPTNNLRHSFITLRLQEGFTPVQIAELVGNTPEVIYNHYCGSVVKDIQLPSV
jgi:hypothetical protein